MNTSIIGCGNVGKEIAQFLDSNNHFNLTGLVDIDNNAITKTLALLKSKPQKMSIEEAINNTELIIECAHKDMVGDILNLCSGKNKKVIILSVGGLLENIDLQSIECEISIPSGAIAGLDAIRAVRGKIDSLTLTTTKSPQALGSNLKEKTTVFEGNVQEAVKKFPRNINVAAGLLIASRYEDIKVKIVADPEATRNTHEIMCTGAFGKITCKTENQPSNNPKTSYLAVLSTISLLKSFVENINIA